MFSIEKFGDRVAAINDDNKSFTYSDLKKIELEIKEIISKRTLVFSLCSNTIGSLAGYVSFLNNRIVPLLLTQELDRELFDELLEKYHPEYIWAPNNWDLKDYEIVYNNYDYKLYKTGMQSYPLYEELALLLTTSGSTGSPKLVRQSYKNIQSNTESIIQYLGITEKERPITTLPMNYTYGLSIINTHLYVGATILLSERKILEKAFWDFFKEKGATSFGGVPYTYEILNKLRFFRMELPTLKTMTQAGGKLSPELHKKFAEFAHDTKREFVVMYGQTEATARMAYLPSERSIEKYGSMGIAIPGGKFELVDIDKKVIEETEKVGELVYKGDNVTLGYAESGTDLIKGDERNGCLFTGDMARQDKDGFYYIVGRKKRFLKIFGNRVNLDEVERLIKSGYSNIDCACSGVDDQMKIYVTNINSTEELLEIKEFVSNKTNLNKSAFDVEIVDIIPKNEAGKTLYSKLGK